MSLKPNFSVPAISHYSLIIQPVAIPVNTYLVVIPKEWGFVQILLQPELLLIAQLSVQRSPVLKTDLTTCQKGFPAMLCLRYYSYPILAYPRIAVNSFFVIFFTFRC